MNCFKRIFAFALCNFFVMSLWGADVDAQTTNLSCLPPELLIAVSSDDADLYRVMRASKHFRDVLQVIWQTRKRDNPEWRDDLVWREEYEASLNQWSTFIADSKNKFWRFCGYGAANSGDVCWYSRFFGGDKRSEKSNVRFAYWRGITEDPGSDKYFIHTDLSDQKATSSCRMQMKESICSRMKLTNADVAVMDFTGSKLWLADFRNARLTKKFERSARIARCTTSQINLEHADISGADFRGAMIEKDGEECLVTLEILRDLGAWWHHKKPPIVSP